MSTKTNITMNSIYKLLVIFTIFMFSQRSFSQRNADPGIGILMVPATVTQGSTGTLSAGVGNYGNSTIVANSLRVTISVGLDAEIIGIATGSDSRWTQLSLTSGSGNTIRLKNTEGGFGAFDVGYILITIRGNLVSGPDLIFGNIVYITASNTLLCGICPPIPLNVSQGNASTSNDNSQTSLAVTSSVIDAVVDTFPSQTPGTTVPTTVGNVTTNDTLNGVPVTASNTDVTPVTTGPLSIDALGVVTLAPNTPSGSYPITYTICEVNPVTGLAVTPANCDSVTDTIVVVATIDAVADTFPSQTPGTTVPTTVGNVTTNDTLNGVPVTASNTDVTPVTTGPLSIDALGVVTLAPNTPSGSYPITYTICEVNPVTGIAVTPANCDSVTITIIVVAPIIDAITETTTPSINGHVGGLTLPLTNNDLLNGMPVVVGVGGNVTISLPNTLPIGLSLNTTTGIVTVAPNTPAGIYPVTYTICEIINPSNCDTVTSYIVVYLTDFTPTIDIDNVVFLTPEVTRDFVVNISEIESSPSVGQIIFKIPKQQAFSITYDSNATNSNVNGGTIVNNNDWIITENSIFITVTLKPNIVIEASAFSSVGFKISRKINVPNQTWQPITATIVSGSGSDSVNDNNTYNVLVKAQ